MSWLLNLGLGLAVLLVSSCDRGGPPAPVASTAAPTAAAAVPATPAPAPAKVQQPPQPSLVPITNMVRIPAGTFLRLGHRVTLREDFWIGKYEVTQAEFLALAGRNPSHFATDPQRPVEKVAFVEAQRYGELLTKRELEAGRIPAGFVYRLPTEAEWEYACRSGSTNLFSFGDAVADADAYAWTEGNSQAETHPVGLKLPNAWGLYDMHGNVWEWCSDWFTNYPSGDLVDPVGPPQGKFKVFRGGGWNNEAKFARASNRFMMAPASGIHFVGFRIALGHPR